jgi:MFS transporter, ACS family, D-galactonate transporter
MTTSTARPTRARFVVLALLATGTMINYLDRTVLGIAAPVLTKDLGLSAAVMGFVFSAFSWTYALAQIPGGLFLDRFGARITYFLSVSLWSVFTVLQGFATGLYSLIAYRFGLGLAEAPCFPTNSRVVTTWFPQQERARATGVYTVGEYLGLACFSPALIWLIGAYGWRAPFIATGVAGLVFALVWWVKYREPHESRTVNRAELDYIAQGGGLVPPQPAGDTEFSWARVRGLLRFRQIWGACLGQFGGNSTLGFFAVMPFLAAAVGVMFGGWLSDALLQRTGSANVARKLPIIAGLLGASTIILANFVSGDVAVITILSIAFFAQGMTGLGWALISDIAPKNLMGLTGGVFNFAANVAGIITPLVIGLIVGLTGSFHYALA